MVIKEKPETPLPEPSDNQSPENHTQMSVRFQEHIILEKAKGNRLQTSEKIWGSVAQAINALGKRRGWKTSTHESMQDVVIQLGKELDGPRMPRKAIHRMSRVLNEQFSAAEGMHRNFYRNNKNWGAIHLAQESADDLVDTLGKFRDQKPVPYKPKTDDDLLRLGRLLDIRDPDTGDRARIEYLREVIPVGVADPNGFSPNYGYRKPGSPDDDGEGNGGGVSNPDPPADGGQGGGATINDGRDLKRRPFVQSFTTEEQPGKPGPTNWKTQRQEPKARAAVAAHSSRPGRERRQVIAPRFGGRR